MRLTIHLFALLFYAFGLFGDIAFMTNWDTNIYKFNTDDPSSMETVITTAIAADCITVSPDGKTVYFTSNTTTGGGGDVYTFPVNGPYVPVALGTGIAYPIGIAISSDGTTCFVVTNTGAPGIYTFPTGVLSPPVTQLTSTGATIGNDGPTFIVISGDTAYVSDYESSPMVATTIYSFPVTPNQTTFNATSIQTFSSSIGSGLAVSSDGFLYFSSADGVGNTRRVPLSSPTDTPEVIGLAPGGPCSYGDGLAITNDGKTCFVPVVFGCGLTSFPTDQGPVTATVVNATTGVAVAIVPGSPACRPYRRPNNNRRP